MIPHSKADRLFAVAVIGVTFVAAAAMFIAYARNPDGLWREALADRNSHLASAMIYAGAWRAGNIVEIIVHAAQSTVWPPVHAMLLGFVLLPWMDYRLGIVVSLAGWGMTVVFSALIARRLFSDESRGIFAGSLAALFVIASPAFRLLGADVMLEGLGAGLSALSLYLYLRAMEQPAETRRWRWLGLALTLLFFEKYNYWAMMAVALAIGFVTERAGLTRATCRGWFAAMDRRRTAKAIVRDPLLIAALVIAVLVVVISITKPAPVPIFGKMVGLYPPENLTTVAYALIVVRLALLWRRHRIAFEHHAGPALRVLAYWHVAPILLSFLIPKRLSGFVWFLGPSNNAGAVRSDPIAAAIHQWPGFVDAFHVALWSALLVIALGALGACRLIRVTGGAKAVAVFPLVSACALLSHPQQQWRFETTWLFGLWICAGVGGALLLGWIVGRWPRPARVAGAAVALAALAAAHAAQPVSPMAALVAFQSSTGPSDVEFARAFLPHIRGKTPVGFVTTFGRTGFPTWVVRSDCGCDRVVDAPFDGATRADARAITEAWIARTRAVDVVMIDAPGIHEIPELNMTSAIRGGALDAMRAQSRFRLVAEEKVPAFGATVSIWRRGE